MTPTPVTAAEQDCPNSSAVVGLAREVETIRRTLDEAATSSELDRLAQVVSDLADAISPKHADASPTAPSWLAIARDEHATTPVLAHLTGWLGSVYLRYADAARTLPECWLWHPDVVEELVWLMHAWLAAYDEAEGSVRAAGDWHDRHRPGVVRRIGDYARACSLENHLPDRAAKAPIVPVIDAAEAIALWWAQARDERAPAPTDDQMVAAAAAVRQARTGGGH
ncbi:MAG: hypothetical protein ACRDP9_04520 [Kribbellaceae bacterium]